MQRVHLRVLRFFRWASARVLGVQPPDFSPVASHTMSAGSPPLVRAKGVDAQMSATWQLTPYLRVLNQQRIPYSLIATDVPISSRLAGHDTSPPWATLTDLLGKGAHAPEQEHTVPGVAGRSTRCHAVSVGTGHRMCREQAGVV